MLQRDLDEPHLGIVGLRRAVVDFLTQVGENRTSSPYQTLPRRVEEHVPFRGSLSPASGSPAPRRLGSSLSYPMAFSSRWILAEKLYSYWREGIGHLRF